VALIGDGPEWTYAQLASEVDACRRALPEGPLVFAPKGRREDVVRVLAALEGERALALLHPRWSEPEREEARGRFLEHHQPGDVVVFTSGSSGRPKGVRLTRDTFCAAASAHAEALPFEARDRWLLTLPLAHVGGMSVLTRCLASHSTIVLGPSRFETDSIRSAIDTHSVTLLSLVPTMLIRLMEAPPPPSLRAVLLGGAACSDGLLARGRAEGWPLLPTYGSSETCAQACTQRLDDARGGGVGSPMPGVAVRLDPEGEIHVAGPTVMRGYLGAPPLDGPFATGDLGRWDERGHLHVVGRRGTRIITGGENVDPVEVEMALETHPHVARACVIGRPDSAWGERVSAIIVVADGRPPSLAELRAHLAGQLASYKHPRALVVLASLDELPTGKLDRRAAEASAAELWNP